MTKNLLICIPLAKTSLDVEFFESYIRMKDYLVANASKLPFELGYIQEYLCKTFPIDANRNQCVSKVLEVNGIQHDISIWLDTDQSFPDHTLFSLLKHPYPIVAGMYYAKAEPFFPIVFKYSKESKKLFNSILDYPDELFEADMIGMGCVKIERSVLQKLDKPYFKYQRHDKNSNAADSQWRYDNEIADASEDVWFWRQVRDKGFKIVIDPKIQCGHIMRLEANEGLFKSFLNGSKEKYIEVNGQEAFNVLWENQCRAKPIN